MAARLIGHPQWRFWNSSDSTALAGGKVYFYTPGTTTAKNIYDNTDKQTTLSNPVTLTSGGFLSNPVYGEGIYDVVIKTSADVTIETVSNWGDDWSAVGTDLSENKISNHSFETAGSGTTFENWTDTDSGSVISRDTSDSYHGAACVKFTNSQNGADYITSAKFEVSPGKDEAIDFFVKSSNASAEPKLQITWYTAAQASISTSTVYDDNVGLTPTSWTLKQGFRVTPPATSRYGELVVVGNDNATQYTTQFDGIRVYSVSNFPEEAPYVPFGLDLSIDAGDTDHDINVTAGAVKSDDYSDDLVLTSEITKQIDATWSAGDDQGGLASGESLSADGMVYVWVIKNSSTGYVDVLLSTSATSPTMPSGYDVKRYIGGARLNASSNLIGATWKGSVCVLDSRPTAEIDSNSLSSATYVEYEIGAPPSSVVKLQCYMEGVDPNFLGNAQFRFRATTSSDSEFLTVGYDPNGSDVNRMYDIVDFLLDSSASLDYTPRWQDSATEPQNTIYVLGWDDLRRNVP